ncbi:bactofilin family protein [Paenibacillus hamazuiensis]|uniref:bactofilin family protein n=1 Tax=Paenibacillus hamazuiensis TaxID=2936508 RepID=UPI0020108082|nr:polymer-forming cytoskeletal protein [Paenibacillus hamazuiensis]
MFHKKTAVHPGTTDTLIGEGTVFNGSLSSKADIRIEGQVIGEIHSAGEITIGEKGYVQAEIKTKDIIVAGKLQGKVAASGRLTITSTGQLKGTVQAKALVIDQGAVFQGTSDMKAPDFSPAAEDSAETKRTQEGAQPLPATV